MPEEARTVYKDLLDGEFPNGVSTGKDFRGFEVREQRWTGPTEGAFGEADS